MGNSFVCLALMLSSARMAAGSTSDPCTCLKWSEAYAGQVVCGEFAELRGQLRPRVNFTLGEISGISHKPEFRAYYTEKCIQWLPYMVDNYCLNLDNHAFSGWVPGATGFDVATWCYVSKECSELNGGQVIADKVSLRGDAVPRFVSAKLCTAGRDRSLRDLSIQELAEAVRRWQKVSGDKQQISLGLVALEAYKALHPRDGSWNTIEPVLATGMLDLLPPVIYNAIQEKHPVIVYVNLQSHASYKVLQGRELFHLDDAPETRLWGRWHTGRRLCPDTVHCLRREEGEVGLSGEL